METLVIKHTVRGGKEVEHDGDIIVLGDLYQSATVSAGGNVVVMGTAKGNIVAGKRTGDTAVITVGKFQCPYVKIGRYSARQEVEGPTGPEYLSVEKGQLISKTIKTV